MVWPEVVQPCLTILQKVAVFQITCAFNVDGGPDEVYLQTV
jgi:hypothetical protein